MNELQKKLDVIARSNETYKQIVSIGDKHNLMLDGQGELAAEIRDVIMGFKSSKDFIKNIQERLEIDAHRASEIAADVSKEIFEAIRADLQNLEGGDTGAVPTAPLQSSIPPEKSISHETTFSNIEQVGQFTLDRTPKSTSPQYKEALISKEKTLEHIEDKPDHPPITLTDHLLSNPVINVEKQIIETQPPIETKTPEKIVAPETKAPASETKKYTVDPYREIF